MVKLKKLTNIEDIVEYTKIFNKSIGYSNVPWEYHASGDVYALIVNKQMVAGFVLVPGYFNLRSVLQMPQIQIKSFYKFKKYVATNLCDQCGYFINTTSFWQGLLFTFYMVLVCMFYKKRYFIYTYPVQDVGLERYYGQGKPLRVHTGKPEKLPGHGEHMESEHVEILTWCGICKIFWYRTKRALRAKKLAKKKASIKK
jgi:hypothetical protein